MAEALALVLRLLWRFLSGFEPRHDRRLRRCDVAGVVRSLKLLGFLAIINAKDHFGRIAARPGAGGEIAKLLLRVSLPER